MTDYLVAMATFTALYGLMALGLNIVWGMAGMINLGLVGFFALGGYASALLTVKFGVPIVVGLVAAFVFAALCGSVMALLTARLRGDYLAIVTLGFAEVVRIVASNEIWLTNGTDGISGIPGPWRGRIARRISTSSTSPSCWSAWWSPSSCCRTCGTRRSAGCSAPSATTIRSPASPANG